MAKKLAFSYTALNNFDGCPKRYYYTYIEKLIESKSSPAAEFGTKVHDNIERRVMATETFQYDEDVALRYPNLEKLCRIVVRLKGRASDFTLEKEITLTDSLEPTYWRSSDAWLRFRINMFAVVGDTAIVVDWKTGKRRPDPFQLEMYVLASFIIRPHVKEVKASFAWLDSGEKDTKLYTPGDALKILAKLNEKINRVHEAVREEYFPAKPSGLCAFCGIYNTCKEAKKSLGSLWQESL